MEQQAVDGNVQYTPWRLVYTSPAATADSGERVLEVHVREGVTSSTSELGIAVSRYNHDSCINPITLGRPLHAATPRDLAQALEGCRTVPHHLYRGREKELLEGIMGNMRGE